MKVSCLRENLKAGLSIAGRAVAGINALQPVLRNVCLATQDRKLAVSATNLAIGIRVWIGAKIDEDGEITVPAHTLTDLVNLLPPDRIDLQLNGRATLNLTCGNTEANVKGLPAEEFMQVPDYSGNQNLPILEIEPFVLEQMLARTVFAASTDDSRPTLTAVYLHGVAGRLALAAADGFRLSLAKTEVPIQDFPALLIPRRGLAEVRHLVANETEQVRIIANQNATQAAFIFSNTHLVTQLIDGTFPEYKSIIQSKHAIRAVLSPAELHRAMKTVLVYAREAANITRWWIGIDKLKLSAAFSEIGDGTVDVEAKVEGETPFEIALNGRYVLDVMNALSGVGEIELLFINPTAPAMIRIAGDESFTHVIMPMHF